MKWKRLLKDYEKLTEEDKDLFKNELVSSVVKQKENFEVDDFVEEDPDFDVQKELEKCCECDCECDSATDEDEFSYLSKLDMRINVARSLTYLTNPDGTPYFPVEWIAENILKMKK